ncbi:ATP-binding cassette domain-containing protein, partial [Streptomyces sp. NPDC000405]|uniref:ATP-binding cassette domain-containing protein n=1 Tax=Streptomyces sp. NPDC000405 TaxID=3161033 RepID=UPI00398D16A3
VVCRAADPNRALPLTAAELDSILDETPPQLHVVERDRPQGGLDDATAAIHFNVSGARVALGGAEVLHGIDLSIAVGEFLAIAGASGAGKSTLTRAIAGLVPLRSGTIDLDGIPVADMHAHRLGEQVGYVFQNPEHQFPCAKRSGTASASAADPTRRSQSASKRCWTDSTSAGTRT